MSGITAAVLGGLAAGAVGAAGAAIAGNQAAKATEGATNAAVNEQKQALTQQQQLAQPYMNLGSSAIPTLENLMGMGPNGSAGELAALQQTPGYQFTQQQGNQATLNAATAAGMLNSGNTLEALDQYNTGLADQTYQQTVGNTQAAVGLGQAAAAGQAANIGSAASNISSSLINQGTNTANIDMNTIAGITKSLGNAGNDAVIGTTLASLNPNQLTPYTITGAAAAGDM